MVENESDVAAFENFSIADASSAAAPAAAAAEPVKEEAKAAPVESKPEATEATSSHGGRVLASPLARVSYTNPIIGDRLILMIQVEDC